MKNFNRTTEIIHCKKKERQPSAKKKINYPASKDFDDDNDKKYCKGLDHSHYTYKYRDAG